MIKNLLIIAVIILSILFYKCNNNIERKYYNSGELRSECLQINDSKKCSTFYKNGNMQGVFYLVKDKVQGRATSFTEDGVYKLIANYEQGKREGLTIRFKFGKLDAKTYYESDTPIFRINYPDYHGLKGESFFGKQIDTVITDENTSILRMSYFTCPENTELAGVLFVKDEKITALSDYLTIEPNKDTLNINEEYKAEFNLYLRDFNKAKLVLGEYNDNLKIIKPKSPDTVYITEDKPYIHKIKAVKLGLNRLTGVVIGYNDSLYSEPKPFYKVFYVKEK